MCVNIKLVDNLGYCIQDPRFYKATLTLKSYVPLIREINERLTENRLALLRDTCFGPWLQLEDDSADPLLFPMFLQCQVHPDNVGEHEMLFDVCDHIHRFGREEFCLITGFRFGTIPSVRSSRGGVIARRLGIEKLTSVSCLHWFFSIGGDDGYDDDEACRITLLTMASKG